MTNHDILVSDNKFDKIEVATINGNLDQLLDVVAPYIDELGKAPKELFIVNEETGDYFTLTRLYKFEHFAVYESPGEDGVHFGISVQNKACKPYKRIHANKILPNGVQKDSFGEVDFQELFYNILEHAEIDLSQPEEHIVDIYGLYVDGYNTNTVEFRIKPEFQKMYMGSQGFYTPALVYKLYTGEDSVAETATNII